MFIDPLYYFIALAVIEFSAGFIAGYHIRGNRRRRTSRPVLFEYPRTRHE